MSTISITAIMLAAVLFLGFFLPSSLATAQLLQQQQEQQQQQTTTTTTTTPSPSSPPLSITTTIPSPPLTPEEQAQQNRLQSTIAATTRDLNETEKEVDGVVFTPRWSEPVVWVNPNSIAVLIAYCLPGEFADSGQEILGGFELEVLESYAVALPQGFMAWMAVVGNEDGNVRLPAALGVICASDLNRADTRVLSPQEQQEINNINQQFSTIQNTQITNIDQVINIINNVTSTPLQNGTGGGGMTTPPPPPPGNDTGGNDTGTTTPPPPGNDTGVGGTEQPLRIEIIPNATIARPCNIPHTTCVEAYTGATIKFDSSTTGGEPPYYYYWMTSPDQEIIDRGHKSITLSFFEPGIFTYVIVVNDRHSNIYSDRVQVTIQEQSGVLLPPETGQEGEQPQPGGGLLPRPRTVPPLTNETGTTMTPATNDTGAAVTELTQSSSSEPPLIAEAIANATQAVAPATIKLDANITGGAPPYSYSWSDPNLGLIDQDRSITLNFFEPGTFTYGLTVTDSRGKVVTDNVQIVISERLPQGGIVAPEPGATAPPPLEGGGVSPGVPEGGEGEEPEGGVSPPSTTEEQGGEEPPAPPPPSDDTEEGEGTPPSTTTEEEPTTPPDGGG